MHTPELSIKFDSESVIPEDAIVDSINMALNSLAHEKSPHFEIDGEEVLVSPEISVKLNNSGELTIVSRRYNNNLVRHCNPNRITIGISDEDGTHCAVYERQENGYKCTEYTLED
ncbi:hypothetical protein M1145_00515 [Patescibacteria group bacterium]|nr:hypothetical protein [Patescibacteria group bacterium]